MLGRIWRIKHAAAFIGRRFEDYRKLARLEAVQLRQELIRTALGLAVLVSAGLLCLCFFSVALIVSAWETPSRILVAWLVCLLWAALAAAGLFYARQMFKQTAPPFEDLGAEISRDLTVLKEML